VALPWTKKDVVFSGILLALAVALSIAVGVAGDEREKHAAVRGELAETRVLYTNLGDDLVAAERRAVGLTDDLNRAYNGTLEIASIGTELEGSITESIAATMGIGRNIARLTDAIDELERVVRGYQEIIRATERENQPP
jgi:hypothetical protein